MVNLSQKQKKDLTLIIALLVPIFLFGPAEYLAEKPDPAPKWVDEVGAPLKYMSEQFGEATYSDSAYAYWTLLICIGFSLLLIPYIYTGHPRYLFLALFMAPLAVVIQDWAANISAGNTFPTWEGPANTGFIGKLPTFYYPLLIWGLLGMFLWFYYEKQFAKYYRKAKW